MLTPSGSGFNTRNLQLGSSVIGHKLSFIGPSQAGGGSRQSRNERKRHKGCEEKRDLKILHCHTAGFEEKKDPQGKEYIQYLETGKVKK